MTLSGHSTALHIIYLFTLQISNALCHQRLFFHPPTYSVVLLVSRSSTHVWAGISMGTLLMPVLMPVLFWFRTQFWEPIWALSKLCVGWDRL